MDLDYDERLFDELLTGDRRYDIDVRADGTQIIEHPITRGIRKAMAKNAVALEVPDEASLIKAGDRTVLAAMPYRMGRVVVASFGQWFLPETRWWLGRDWWMTPSVTPWTWLRGVTVDLRPVERGDGCQLPLLNNVIAWLTEPRNDPERHQMRRAFAEAQLVALKVQHKLLPQSALRPAMEELIAQSEEPTWHEEALWAAGNAFHHSPATFDYDVGSFEGGYVPDPAPQYYERLIRQHLDSPLLSYARWRLAECARLKSLNEFVQTERGELELTELIPLGDEAEQLVARFEEVNALEGSYAWAWTELRLGELHFRSGSPEKALRHYREVAETMPPGPEKLLAILSQAICYEELGQPDEAKRYYSSATRTPNIIWRTLAHGGWAPLGADGYWEGSTHSIVKEKYEEFSD